LDGPEAQLQAGGQRLRFFDAVAKELEEAAQRRLPLDKGEKARFRRVEPGEGFLFEEGGIGVRSGVGDKLDGADEVAVINLDRNEVLGVGEEPILLAMMEPGNVPEDEPFDLPQRCVQRVIIIGRELRAIAAGQELEDGLCGEAVGVVAIGQKPVGSAAPG